MSEAFATPWDAIPELSGYWYLASPYSRFGGGLTAAWRLACRHAGEMVRRGHVVYSPVAHSHPIGRHAGLPIGDQELWRRQWEPLLRGADGLAVLMLPGWKESEGIAAERALADGPPITVYLEPLTPARAVPPPINPREGW